MINEIIKCKEVVFHFNKGHLQDSSIPMWILKFKGKSRYVDHVTANAPWTTKETPNNPATKGALKFKNVVVSINQDNHASINME